MAPEPQTVGSEPAPSADLYFEQHRVKMALDLWATTQGVSLVEPLERLRRVDAPAADPAHARRELLIAVLEACLGSASPDAELVQRVLEALGPAGGRANVRAFVAAWALADDGHRL